MKGMTDYRRWAEEGRVLFPLLREEKVEAKQNTGEGLNADAVFGKQYNRSKDCRGRKRFRQSACHESLQAFGAASGSAKHVVFTS